MDVGTTGRPCRWTSVDAVVVGSGPNGLAAAVTLAAAGLRVEVIEGAEQAGGGCRTEALTLPGYRHDVCSAVHPFVLASPFFRQSAFGSLRATLCQPDVPFAHPLDDGRAVAAYRSLEETCVGLGRDGPAYRRLMGPLVRRSEHIADASVAPLRTISPHPVDLARFGLPGLLPVSRLVHRFDGDEASALFAGVSAHSMSTLSSPLTGAFGLILALTAHSVGWPVVAGGSSGITAALVAELERLGGTVTTGQWVTSLSELPRSTVVLLDTSPRALVDLAGPLMPERGRRALGRFRYGPGVCKVDWALSGPVPWAAEACRRAGTVHVGGSFAEVAASESDAVAGRHSPRPFCLVVQPSVTDPTRAPSGMQTLWAYCHVPAGSDVDMTARIEGQIERFAPGFGDLILARSTVTAKERANLNPNLIGGEIGGGVADLRQTVFRPTVRWHPYRTPLDSVYLCSASTPPGGGVHGMCGVYAARSALHDHFGGPPPFRIGASGEGPSGGHRGRN
jgi:phytoene dehydrogenase-like protein